MLYEPTSWYSYSQVLDIFKRLSDENQYESILFQIELWKARGRVPAAIHATYLLLSDCKPATGPGTRFNICKEHDTYGKRSQFPGKHY
eukprot:XP_764654.1 hypothetical protein [Theileria parva strain Muguga]